MTTPTVRLHRWDEIALEKVTEMISRKIVTGERLMSAQVYLKQGALRPKHSHESEQMTTCSRALKFLINGEEITVREGKCCTSRRGSIRRRRSTTRSSSTSFSPIRQDWLTTPTLTFRNSVIRSGDPDQGSGDRIR